MTTSSKPTTGIWALMVLDIEVGSISTCTMVAFGQNFLTLLVTRSSNLAPKARITSAFAMALLASKLPCIPNMPIKLLCRPDIPPNPIRVLVTGALSFSTNSVNNSAALAMIMPPPAYITSRFACVIVCTAFLIWRWWPLTVGLYERILTSALKINSAVYCGIRISLGSSITTGPGRPVLAI